MIFTLEVFQTVGKFSDINRKDNGEIKNYSLKNLDNATSEELKTLRGFENAHLLAEDRHAFTNYEELEKY